MLIIHLVNLSSLAHSIWSFFFHVEECNICCKERKNYFHNKLFLRCHMNIILGSESFTRWLGHGSARPERAWRCKNNVLVSPLSPSVKRSKEFVSNSEGSSVATTYQCTNYTQTANTDRQNIIRRSPHLPKMFGKKTKVTSLATFNEPPIILGNI